MAFIKSVVKLILREHEHYRYEGPVLALGVPEIYATRSELSEWSEKWMQKPAQNSDELWTKSRNEMGKKLGWVSARYFFASLGLDEVTYMDIPGAEHAPDFVHDLNQPLPSDRINRYRLVMDPGTIEHVFDMKTCLANVVNALQVGGVVVHQVPVYMFNGGYYSLNPNLLNDYYAKNGFNEIRTYIVMWDRYHPYTGKSRVYEYSERGMGARHALADLDQVRYSPMMLFIARKVEERAELVSPLQFDGAYHKPVQVSAEVASKGARSHAARVRAAIRNVVSTLPDVLADEINGHLTRLGAIARSRRQSFRI